MTENELIEILNKLLKSQSETEVFEFKEAKNNYDFDNIGKYFSALSNEANLKNKPYSWLIFGVEDKKHKIVGTKYRNNRKDLDNLKGEIANKIINRITFIEIYELNTSDGRVILFQIPAAPTGIPVSFNGHYYGRDGESLSALNLEEIERIRSKSNIDDWSSGIIENATIDDLDKKAISVARDNYKNKFSDRIEEINNWDDITFLNKAKITIKGKITRTALVLLGKEESEYLLNPADVKIRWVLKDSKNNEKDYQILSCPFLLAVDKVYSKIRNLKYRYIKDRTLFPDEVDQYEPYIIREAINNCIAHQDYTKGGRINVVEMEDQLVFSNLGSFIPGDVEKVIKEDAPQENYRNRFLVSAMCNLKMVDTIGGGIKKMFNYQRLKFFPLPEYDITQDRVVVTIMGKILDMEYARVLARYSDLELEDIIMLDKVQKKKLLTEKEERYLKKKGLIEGRRPNYFISLKVAQKTGQKAEYSKNKAFDGEYYSDLIIKAIKEHRFMERKDIDALLWNKLPELMNDKQKKIKINNLIATLRKKNKIENEGNDAKPKWVISKK